MTRKTTLASIALSLIPMTGITNSLHAQPTTAGEIRGTVVDASGAMISRAQITIATPAGVKRKLKSGAKGGYEVPNLAPGFYSIRIDAAGFTQGYEWVEVVGNRVTRDDITLAIPLEQPVESMMVDSLGDSKQDESVESLRGNR